jgi:sugar/nucleoside kinase (ribokinase family)
MCPSPEFDILVAGEINPDLILSGDVEPAFGQVEKLVESAALTIGSSSAIFACGARRLGLRVAIIGLCGEDVFGRFMLEQLRRRGVNTDQVLIRAGENTGLTVILNRGADRAILTFPGLIPALRGEDIPDKLLRQARHLHVASYFLQTALKPGLPGLFQRAHSFGLTTSLDTNYDPSEAWSGFDELLAETDIFLPNKTEACSLTHSENADEAANKLAGKVQVVAIKLGAAGALGVKNSQKASATSVPVQVVDTVGAGDSFDAGFLYGYLSGWSLERMLYMGTVCGALSTRKAGGTEAQPTLEEASGYLP